MLIPVVVFALVVAVVVGSYYVFVHRPEAAARGVIVQRLSNRGSTEKRARKRSSLLRSTDDLTAVPLLDRLIAPLRRFTQPLEETIGHADLKLTVGALLTFCALASAVAFALALILTGYEWLALAIAAPAFMLPLTYVRFKASRRLRVFEEQFPEAIDLISRALRAGHAFTTALSMAADEIPLPVGAEFKRLYDEQNFGMPLTEAMRDFAARIPLLDAKFFVTAVLTQRESGGNLAEVLDNLAKVIRERFKVKRQVRVISAHGRITGTVLMSLPPALALAFAVISDTHVSALTSDILGWYMLGTAAALQTLGCLIIRKLVNIEY